MRRDIQFYLLMTGQSWDITTVGVKAETSVIDDKLIAAARAKLQAAINRNASIPLLVGSTTGAAVECIGPVFSISEFAR